MNTEVQMQTGEAGMDFLRKLRSGTSSSHAALEKNPLSARLMSADLQLQDYKMYLCKMYTIIQPFEEIIFPLLKPVLPDIEERRKTQLLEKDLEHFQSLSPPNRTIDGLTDTAEMLGQMYVLEGSVLGGNIIFRHVQKTLDLDQNTGASFFYGYGAKTGYLWKGFLDTLCTYAIAHNKEEEIVHAAIGKFDEITEWFNS